jgi:hypothetical protein
MPSTRQVRAEKSFDRMEIAAHQVQTLSEGGLKPLAALLDHLDLARHFPGDAALHGADPVMRSPHHGEASGKFQKQTCRRQSYPVEESYKC